MIQLHTESYVQPVDWTLEPAGAWTEQALCAQTDPDVFFSEHGGSLVDAKSICQRCPVIAECLAFAMQAEARTSSTRFGVWAGLSPDEREQLHNAGWRPGDPTPPVRNAPGWCDVCEKPWRNLDRHVSRAHPECAA